MARLAIYPGSFDPPTLGHRDVAQRASRLFDEVIVAIGSNSRKNNLLSVEDRLRALESCFEDLPNVRVQAFDGLLVDYARAQGAGFLVRGLRAVSDFDYEFQISMANDKLAPEIETVLLMTSWEFSFVSSTIVREVFRLGGDLTGFVPPSVIEIMESARNQ